MAAGNIKGITIEFNGDTTRLDKALKQVKSESKAVDSQLKEVNRAIRFNPNNVELLKQKFTLLGQKVDQTEAELKQFRQIEAQLKAQNVSKQSAAWMKVRRDIIEAESKMKHFKAEMAAIKYQNITNMGNAFKTAGQNMRTAGMYSTIGAGAMIMSGKKLLELNSTQQQAENKLIEIYKTRMGVNKEAAQSTMDLASALQKQGVIGDEVTLSGAQQLATYAKYPSTVNKLLPAMDNLLVQQKGYNASADDAKNIANLFGKAMMGNAGALKRAGVTFTDAQAEVLKYGTEEEKAAMLAEVVTQNVGDMNKAFADTDEGKLAQVKNTMGDIGERLGHVLLPALAQFADYLSSNVVPKIESLVSFIEAHPVIAKIAVGITALLSVAGPLLIFIGALIGAIGTITTAFTSMAAAETVALGPIALIVAGIAAAIAIGVLLYKNWDKIKKFAVKTWDAIKKSVSNAAKAVKDAVTKNWNTLKTTVTSVFTAIKNVITTVWNTIKKVTSTVWNGIKTVVTTIFKAILTAIKWYFNAYRTVVITIFNAIKTIATAVWNGIKVVITTALKLIKTAITAYFNAYKTIITTVFNAIKTVVTTVWTAIKNTVTKAVTSIKTTVTNAFNGLKSIVSNAWNAVKNSIINPIKSAATTVSNKVNEIKNKISSGFSGIKKTVSNAFSGIKSTMTKPFSDAWSTIKSIASKISGKFPLHIGKVFSGLKLPHFKILSKGKFPWGIAGKGSMPKWDVSWYKTGGIFDQPTIAGIGEAGTEAVLPLDTFWEKMDSMADSIVNGLLVGLHQIQTTETGPATVTVPIYLYPNGPKMGEEIVKTYDTYKRRIG